MSSATLDHDQANAQLLEYAYGELGAEARSQIDRHLPGCDRCRADLDALLETRKAMQGLESFAAPERGLESLLAYADQHAAQHARPVRPKWLTWAMTLVPVGLAASIGLFLVGRSPSGPTALNRDQAETAGPILEVEPPPAPAPAAVAAQAAPSPPTQPAMPTAVGAAPAGPAPTQPSANHVAAKAESAPAAASAKPSPTPSSTPTTPPAEEKAPRRDLVAGFGGAKDDLGELGDSSGKGGARFKAKAQPDTVVIAQPAKKSAAAEAGRSADEPVSTGALSGLANLEGAGVSSQTAGGPVRGAAGYRAAGPSASDKVAEVDQDARARSMEDSEAELAKADVAKEERRSVPAPHAKVATREATPPPPPAPVLAPPAAPATAAAPSPSLSSAPPPAAAMSPPPEALDRLSSSLNGPGQADNKSGSDGWSEASRLAAAQDHPGAARKYQSIADGTPSGPRAAEAMLSAADQQHQAGNGRQAIATLTDLVRRYPHSPSAPLACSEAAAWARELGDEVLAEQFEGQLVSQYPSSPYAARARPQLRQLPTGAVASPPKAARAAPAEFDESKSEAR